MLLRTFLRAKIHRVTVTVVDLDHEDSITIDADLMAAVDLDHLEQVTVWDVTNGARVTTHAMRGGAGSGEIQVNGAAAHRIKPGDQVIIAAYAQVDRSEVATFRARIALVDEDNRLTDTREVGLADRG